MNYVNADDRPRRVRNGLNAPSEQKSDAPSIWDSQEWIEMQVAITGALRPYNEAWDAVAKALKEHHLKYANRKD